MKSSITALLLLPGFLGVFCVTALLVWTNTSFEANTCAGHSLSCLDLWASCVGRYLCADEACVSMVCVGFEQTEPRHGGGLLVLVGSALAVTYAVALDRALQRGGER